MGLGMRWVLVSASAVHECNNRRMLWTGHAVCSHVTSTVPSVPLNVTVQDSAATSLQISWSTPTFSNGPSLTYRVEYTGLATVNGSFFMTFFLETTTTSVNISGLVPFSTYTIGVRASTSVGAGPTAFINATTAEARK